MVNGSLFLLCAVHLWSDGRAERHGVSGDPSGQHHDQDGPAQPEGQEGDREVGVFLSSVMFCEMVAIKSVKDRPSIF